MGYSEFLVHILQENQWVLLKFGYLDFGHLSDTPSLGGCYGQKHTQELEQKALFELIKHRWGRPRLPLSFSPPILPFGNLTKSQLSSCNRVGMGAFQIVWLYFDKKLFKNIQIYYILEVRIILSNLKHFNSNRLIWFKSVFQCMFCLDGQVIFIHSDQMDKRCPSTQFVVSNKS